MTDEEERELLTADTFDGECARLSQAVRGFADVMEAKLYQQASKGYQGWDDPVYKSELASKMLEHAARLFAGDDEQAVDVANLAMMLFYQK